MIEITRNHKERIDLFLLKLIMIMSVVVVMLSCRFFFFLLKRDKSCHNYITLLSES